MKEAPDIDNKNYVSSMYQTTNNMFKSWNGLALASNEKDSHTKSAKNYLLKGHTFYKSIRRKVKRDKNLFKEE